MLVGRSLALALSRALSHACQVHGADVCVCLCVPRGEGVKGGWRVGGVGQKGGGGCMHVTWVGQKGGRGHLTVL